MGKVDKEGEYSRQLGLLDARDRRPYSVEQRNKSLLEELDPEGASGLLDQVPPRKDKTRPFVERLAQYCSAPE